MTLYNNRTKLYFAPNTYLTQCFEKKINLDNIHNSEVINDKPIGIH